MNDIIDYFTILANKYYPKGIEYYDETNNVNYKYLNSSEYLKLLKLLKKTSNKENELVWELMNKISKENKLNLKNITNFHMGDKAINIQNNNFFYEKDLKYFPVCFLFSCIIPYYTYYVIDIDIKMETRIKSSNYSWNKNNGLTTNYNQEITEFIEKTKNTIDKSTKFKMFPNEILLEKVPYLSNDENKMGELSFFKVFFLNDYYCLP